METKEFIPKRVTRSYRQTINALPEAIFPLLCPVLEKEWLDGWDYTMIYSVSGVAEEGAVFTTSNEGEEDTVWVITKHDMANGEVEFTRFTPANRVCVLRIKVVPQSPAVSFVDVSYTFTAITEEGNKFIYGYTENKFLDLMIFWEKSMNHFIKTGTLLKEEAH